MRRGRSTGGRRGALVAVFVAALVVASCGGEIVSPAHVTTPSTGPTGGPVTVTGAARAEVAPSLVTIGSSAAASTPAERLTPPPATACERVATAIAARRSGPTGSSPSSPSGPSSPSVQVIVRTAGWTDTTATVEVATRTSDGWRCGPAMEARVGRTGVRPLLDRRSGDGTTPAGVFGLATMTAPDGQRFSFFGNAPDPGVTAGAYRRVRTGDCFGATPNTSGYGHLRYDTACPGPDDEYLPRFTGAYTNAALIGANMEPDVSGDAPGEVPYAAAIFLHRHAYVNGASGPTKPTSGCVSLAQAELTSVLLGLTPDAVFVIGPTEWLITSA